MAIRRMVDQYEPNVGTEYIGEPGDVWVDLDSNTLRVHVDEVEGGKPVVTTDTNGINDMGGDLWVGNIRDNDSVVWAGPDSEYAALWWSGTRVVEESGYGPYAAIHVGIDSADDMDNAYPSGTQISFNIGEDWEWRMQDDGTLYAAQNITIDGSEGQFLARQSTDINSSNGGYSFRYDGSTDTGMFSHGDGYLQFFSNGHRALYLENMAGANTAKWTMFGSLTLTPLGSAPAGVAGMLAVCDGAGWNGGGDGLQHLMVYINGGWTKAI